MSKSKLAQEIMLRGIENGGFREVKVFCGYKPELVGCSDEDTVK